MQESDLKKGDVIFFRNTYQTDPPYQYIDHVAMYAGLNEKNQPTIIHNISSEKGHYHPERASGLCVTTLRALKDQLQQEKGMEDVRYDVDFLVFRSTKEPVITEYAVKLISNQVRYKIPYDDQRLKDKLELESEGLEGADFKKIGEENYHKVGLYRAIKYAARIPLPIVRTRMDGVGRGLTCSMSVILAYQIAELKIKDLIKPVTTFDAPDVWVSDKYSLSKESAQYPHEYQAYLDKIRKGRSREEENAITSYDCWTGKNKEGQPITPEQFTHDLFPVDAKSIGAEGMYLHMVEQKTTWENLGPLEAAVRRFSPAEKSFEKERRRHDFLTSMNRLALLAEEGKYAFISRSPSPSPSPGPDKRSAESASPPSPWFFQAEQVTMRERAPIKPLANKMEIVKPDDQVSKFDK
jgi:hypothetical protein